MAVSDTNSDKTRRVAKNTALLYVRTLVMLFVSLYTSRVILEALGVVNYGVNNVVGGVIGMFSIISGSLSGSISRFLTFALGEDNAEKLRKIFSLSVNIQIGIGVLIIILAESIGVWFINNKLDIPQDSLVAAHWVFQCCLLSFFIGLISVPYNASLIAHERMGVFAYMTIVDAALKLLVAYVIFITPLDKLITLSVLNLVVSVLMRIFYGWYCTRNFEECHYEIAKFDKKLMREMTSFAWWGFFGNTAWMFNTQGVNILINMFFGVVYNAARGVAAQVEGAVMGFVNNFSTALNPQITKSYASNDKDYLFNLICRGARYTFYTMLFFMIPVWLQAETLLGIWLVDVPPMAATFLRLSIFCTIVTQYGGTAYTAIMATGKIKRYQIVITLVGCLVFPLTWIAYKLGAPMQSTYYVFIVIYLILIWIRLLFLKRLMSFPIMMFVRGSIIPSIIVLVVAIIFPVFVSRIMSSSFMSLVAVTISSIVSVCLSVWFLGSTSSEKKFIKTWLGNKLRTIRIDRCCV